MRRTCIVTGLSVLLGWPGLPLPAAGKTFPDRDTVKNSVSERLDEVVVTGTRTRKALKDVPVVTRLITAEEIKKESPRSLTDLLETELPGIEFTRTEGVTNSVTFQGLGANYLLILVDGERMAGETQRSNPDFNRIDIDDVERIEIVKGAMSTLYGSGAVAGVINIITRGARKPFHAGAQAQYDTEGEQKYGANIGAKIRRDKNKNGAEPQGEFSVYTSGMANIKERYFVEGTEIEGFKNFSLTQKAGYAVHDKWSLSAKGTFYHHERYNAGKAGELMHDIYRDWNALVKGEYKFSPRSSMEVSYNFDDYSKYGKYFRLRKMERNYKDIIHNPKVMFVTEAIRKNTLIAGAEVLDESLDTYQFRDSAMKSAVQSAVFVQDDYLINNKLSVQAGVRLDYHNGYGGVHVSPKLSAMFKTGAWTFRGGYAAGFRTPTLKELYTSWDHQGMFILAGNPDLKPEKSHNLQLSAEYTRGPIDVSVNGYYNHIYDKIATIWNATQDTSFYSNIDHADIYGADANIRARLSEHFTLKAGYAYVNDRQMVDGFNTSATRPHSATLRIEYNFNAWKCPFTVGVNGRYLGSVTAYSRNSDREEFVGTYYEGYSIWKITCAGDLPRGIRLNIGINNLFDYKPETITYNAGITRGITFFAGLSVSLDEMFGLCKK